MSRHAGLGVLRLCFRADARRRWRGWVGGSLLIGVVAGGLLALVIGAEQTRTAYTRFLEESRAFDVVGGSEGCYDPTASCDMRDLRDLPSVEQVALSGFTEVEGQTEDGHRFGGDDGDVSAFVVVPRWNPYDPTRRSTRIGPVLGQAMNAGTVTTGRAADPGRDDEVVVGDAFAHDNRITVDSEITLRFYESNADFSEAAAVDRSFQVVGITRSPGEVRPPNGRYLGAIHTTPAFALTALENRINLNGGAAVRFGPGSAIEDFEQDIERVNIDFGPAFVQADHADGLQRGLDTDAQGLLLVAVLATIAGLVVLAQAINRSVVLDGGDQPTLFALGASAPTRFLLPIARLAPVAIGSAVVAVVVATGVSSTLPRGQARLVDPDLGTHLDLAVVGSGAALLAALVIAFAMVAAWRLSRHPAAVADLDRPDRPRRWGPLVARRIAAVPAAIGLRHALDPGRGRTAVPVRSTVGAIAVTVVALTAALTFRAGAAQLLHQPSLYGETWDLTLHPTPGPGGDEDPGPPSESATAEVVAVLESSRHVEAAAAAALGHSFPDHGLLLGDRRLEVPFLVLDELVGELDPAIIEGRAPERRNEIAMAQATMADLDLSIGDRVSVAGQDGESYEERTIAARIVGQTVLPNISQLGRLGEGVLITRPALEHLDSQWTPGEVAVRLASGAEATTLLAELEERTGIDFEASPPAVGLVDEVERIADLPLLMALLMTVAALALLVHAIATSARRRAPDLAVMRSLGLVGRQVRMALGTEASALALIAVALAVPVGIVVGRLSWLSYADSIGVVPRAGLPAPVLLAAVPALLALCLVLGVAVGRAPARRPVAATLARE